MRYVSKTCSVCGNEFVINENVADRELFCTLGCCSKAMENETKRVFLEV